MLPFQRGDDTLVNSGDGFRGCGWSREEFREVLLLGVGFRWVFGLGVRFAVEEIGHEDLVGVWWGGGGGGAGEDVGALEGLRGVAEDVVDD